jgi:DNA repair photolyase
MNSLTKNRSSGKKSRVSEGTKEWAVKTINCCTGCSHDCLYCYAKEMAIRFKQIQPHQWPLETIRDKDVYKSFKKFAGQVMFPSSHDITVNNLNACEIVLDGLLRSGNRVLVVSKPHIDCIESLCALFQEFKDSILFRFSIGAYDDRILSYWEPNAPSYEERVSALRLAYESGFQTSVSVEPMLDIVNVDALISQLCPYVTNAIWIGKMNHLGRLEKNRDANLANAIAKIRQDQSDDKIRLLYERYKGNTMIKWKKEIKRIVGVPLSIKNGMDI